MTAFAATANAATLTLVSNKITYYLGETITLIVLGDDQGASAYGVFGRLDYSGALLDTARAPRSRDVRAECTDGDQPPGPAGDGHAARDGGVANINWHTVLDGMQLDFFGLTNAPGTSFTIIPCDGCSVPEPATGALLALGLAALAARRMLPT